MKKILLALLASLALSVTPAFAGDSTVGYTAGSGTTFGVVTDGSGNVIGKQAIVDGTAGANKMAVKPASTAPLATDPAAVVAISPNTPAISVLLNTTPSIANGNGVVPTQGGTALSATNGGFTNVLQGNAALSATNGIFSNALQGNAALSGANPSFTALSIGGAVDSATNGVYFNLLQGNAVNASGNPIFTQNTAGSAIIGKVGIDQTTPGTTNGVQVNAALPAGTNLMGKVGIDQTTVGTTNGVSLAQVGTGTVATSATGVQKVGIVGNAGAVFDFAGQNATSPANSVLIGAQFQTTPTTITPGNASPLQLDNAGNLLVNIKAGAGSGGTALGDNAAWTAGTTSMTPAGCEFTTGGATAITTAHAATVGCTAARAMFTDLESVAATALGTPVAYGSTPTGNALSANVFVTNTNANGSATSANSSPVVIASDQAAVAVKAASGAFASGSIASGALASGSIAAGAGVSGAFVAGAIADLAHGQGTMAASVPVTIASNQSAVSVSLAANQSVNVAQFGGVSTSTGQLAVSTAPVTATNTALVVDLRPDSPGIIATGGATTANSVPMILNSQYPVNSVTTAPQPVTATATGTTAATVATIPAVASKTAYICGFTITADATALAVGTAVVSGTISGSLSYLQGVQAVTSGAGNLTQAFNPCIPASAANTAIVVTSAAAGTGGNTIVNAQGYYL